MKHFDLVLVDHGGCKEVCIAPLCKINPGYMVETDFGRGEVISTAFCTDTDDVFNIFRAAGMVNKITAVIVPIEEENDDLSAE